MIVNSNNWKSLLSKGFDLKSSGTIDTQKTIFQTPEKLAAANKIALECQRITSSSRILTVCSMDHAGGVLAQTLPALSVGAHVDIKPFNAYRFWQDMQGFTHTHLTPAHCQLLIKTRSFADVNLTGLFITCGSDRVGFDIIEAFVATGATFMCNWGMTEIGPIAINTTFNSIEQLKQYRQQAIPTASLMGDQYYCEYKILNDELYVKSPTSVYDDWLNTRDKVLLNNYGAIYYTGRSV